MWCEIVLFARLSAREKLQVCRTIFCALSKVAVASALTILSAGTTARHLRDMQYSYQKHGSGYNQRRQADPRIAAQIWSALGDARSVVNVGAGTGNYEPLDREVIAIEPSAVMRSQRPEQAVDAIDASAEHLPLNDKSVDAAMTVLSLHHWADISAGLLEMKRVSRSRLVIYTYDPEILEKFWLFEYLPELATIERQRFPTLSSIQAVLQLDCQQHAVVVPFDCTDGFNEAFYGRPESLLIPEVRACQSAWALLAEGVEERFVAQLTSDLQSGFWEESYGYLRTLPEWSGAIVILVADCETKLT